MGRSDQSAPVSGTRPGRWDWVRRTRLTQVYFFLALFDLLTVSISLLLMDRVAGIYTDSVAVNQVWAGRLDQFSRWSGLAAAVNAPGNDVFQSQDVSAERLRLGAATQRFRQATATIRDDLVANLDPGQAGSILQSFAAIDSSMGAMIASSHQIFEAFEDGRIDEAGAHMARMDREFAIANDRVLDVGEQVRAIQRAHFDLEARRAASIRRFEWIIAALIVGMVAGVTFYGSRLALQARRDMRVVEDLVAARTSELARSNEQLRLSERLAAVGTLAAGLGHDMNNVLFPVRCRLDALDQTNLTAPMREDLRSVRSAVAYLQQLCDGLRLLAIDPGRSEDAGAVDLAAWWPAVEPLLRAALPSAVALEVDVDSFNSAPHPRIHEHRLSQAVFNLVMNAGEAIQGPGVVRIRASSLGDGHLRFAVSDTGTGMTDEVRAHALDPFFTTKKRSLSTGLGLALVHAVTKAANGTVEIESQPGRGTTVTLVLPVAGRAPSRPLVRRVAIAVTDPRLAGFLAGLVRSRGYQTVEFPPAAENGEHGNEVELLICGTDAIPADEARRFLARGNGRRLVAIGQDDTSWGLLSAFIVPPAHGIERVRQVLDDLKGT